MIRSIPKHVLLGIVLAGFTLGTPVVYYRYVYTHSKRLREVSPVVFRSGCMTGPGLEEAIRTHRIKTVLNLMEEAPDADLPNHYLSPNTTKESEVCKRAGAEMVHLALDFVAPQSYPLEQPKTIEKFLGLVDKAIANNEPILIHCKAGLNRTGCLVALYRMEYEGWTNAEAMVELKRMGFGESTSTAANPYIMQYVLGYKPRRLQPPVGRGAPRAGAVLVHRSKE